MKQKKNLMMLLSVVALVVSSFMIAGNVGAMYMADGAAPNGSTGGWNAPTDGICVLSIDATGNMVTDPTIKTARDCQARLIAVTAKSTGDTLANVCGTPSGNTAGVKYAAPGSSTCVTIDGSGYITGSKSMVNLDRGAVMCNGLGGQLANATPTTLTNGAVINTATKTTANGTAAECIAYGWQYRGQDATGTPLPFGATGTAQGSGTGYCYTTMNMTTAYPTQAACPSNQAAVAPFNANAAYDWSWSSSKCTYAKGVAGYLNAALTKVDGTTYAAGAYLDLSTFTTQGACLANGGSWANWIGQAASTTTINTTPLASKVPNWDYTRQAPDADNGCLHCHSYTSQQNGPAERFKDSYLMTGHKNMLRKVIPGMSWAGPDGVIYSQDTAGHPIDFTLGTVGGGTLSYIFGDWMAKYPNAVGPNGDTALYSCGGCHTSGYSDNTNPGVQSIGTPGYTATKPLDYGGAYFATVTPGNKWDLEGINCSRCHNAAVGPVGAAQIAASAFPTTAPTSGGMGALAAGVGRNNLCFGCHQSIAKNYPAQGGTDAGTTQYDPTLIPTGVSHGAAAGRDFNGHVLGNSFLNSVHARYVGVNSNSANGGIKLNSLGKFDLFDAQPTAANTALEYGSAFQGYSCYQSNASANPAKTKADGTEIKTKSECEGLYGAGAWRSDTGSTTAGAAGVQGTCATCHDVHNSLFVASQSEKAIRKDCVACHSDSTYAAAVPSAPQIDPASFNHPTSAGTPFDTTLYGNDSCAVCHMATQAVANGNQNSMAAHVWRINTDPNYSTFPSVGQFYGGACSVHTGAVQNAPYAPVVYLSDISSANCTAASGTWTAVTKDRNAQTAKEYKVGGSVQYNNAVWVDIDMACGQCHGGSLGANNTHNGAMFMEKGVLAPLAAGMHSGAAGAPQAYLNYQNDATASYKVNFDASASICPSGSGMCVYQWSFGDGSATVTTSNAINTHTYASANTVNATMTLVDTTTQAQSSATIRVMPNQIFVAPTALNTVTQAGWSISVQDSSLTNTTDYATSALTVNVDCGNGTRLPSGVGGGFFTCTYTTAGNYTVKETVTGPGGLSSSAANVTKSVPVKCSITGTVTRLGGATPVSGAAVYLNIGTATKYLAVTAANGTYTLSGVVPASYTELVTKTGLTFTSRTVDTTSSCPVPGSVNFSSGQ